MWTTSCRRGSSGDLEQAILSAAKTFSVSAEPAMAASSGPTTSCVWGINSATWRSFAPTISILHGSSARLLSMVCSSCRRNRPGRASILNERGLLGLRVRRLGHRRHFDQAVVWRSSEQLDTFTLAGKMVFMILGAVSELERLIAERIRAGP